MLILSTINKKLQSDEAIRAQLVATLFGDHLYHSVRHYYKKRIESVYFSCFKTPLRKRTKLPTLNGWDWKGILKLPALYLFYEYFMNTFLLYILVKNFSISLFETKILKPLGLAPDKPLSCYMPGKFYLTSIELIDVTISTAATLIHLIWRKIEYSHKQEITLFYFLLLTKRDLRKYNLNFITKKCILGISPNEQQQVTAEGNFEQAMLESFYHETLCYKVKVNQQLETYRLRPNRNERACDKMRQLLVILFTLAISLIILISLIIIPLVNLQLFSGVHQRRYYANCEIGMFWFDIPKHINGSSSFDDSLFSPISSFNWYRLFVYIMDAFENATLWFQSGQSVFSGLLLATILNFDLLVYWFGMQENVLELHRYMKSNQQELNQRYLKNTKLIQRPGRKRSMISLEKYKEDEEENLSLAPKYSLGNIMESGDQDYLDELVNELHCQMHDFFRELKRTDGFMSDVLTLTLIVWFSIFLVYTYISISDETLAGQTKTTTSRPTSSKENINLVQLQQSSSPLHVLIVVVPMVLVTLICWALLILHRKCLITYKYLYPSVALYQSKLKGKFLPILDYFSEHRTCYTLFRLSPFLPITYMSIVGWSFSCFIILKTLLERNPLMNKDNVRH